MKCLSIGKRLSIAAVAAAALAGPVTAAHAALFNVGDAVLVLYGNNTEYYQDLGNMNTLLSTGVDLNLSSIINTNSPGGAGPTSTPLKYTLVGYTGETTTDSIFFGDGTKLSSWTSGNKTGVSAGTIQTGLSGWLTLTAGLSSSQLLAATDANSFSTNMDPASSGSLGGGVPSSRPAFSTIDSTLYLLGRQVGGASGTLAQLGTASLSSQTGHFVVSAVPVPAAVVLFATGVIGLVGLARRKMSGARPEAA